MNDTGAGTVLILGGRSEIGTELALRLAPGASVVLAARAADRLSEQTAAIRAAGAVAVFTREFDADDLHSHGQFVASVIAEHGPIDTAVLANIMRSAGSGSIVVFSSVAGVRVRRANYVYGSAKAGLDGFNSGLADALHGTGVHLLVVRPGFVIGRMTTGMTPAPLPSTPSQVAAATARALAKRRRTVWIPWTLRPLFFCMRLLPQFIWRRMPR